MHINNPVWSRLLWVFMATALTFCTQAPDTLTEGKEYNLFSDQLADQSEQQPGIAQADVIEFFTYGCSHCKDFVPKLVKWHSTHPTRKITYIPVVWNELTEMHAKVFYLIKDKPDFENLHHELFKLVSGFSRTDSLDDQKVQIVVFLQTKGIQPTDTVNALNSSLFVTQTASSAMLTKRLKITGTPALVINHPTTKTQYVIVNSELKKQEDIFPVMDGLLAMGK